MMKGIHKFIVLVALFSSSTSFAFNNTNFKGGYSFRLTGTSSYVLTRQSDTVATGLMTADGKGNIIGHGSFRTAWITCEGSILGIYRVEPDGTGIIATVFSPKTPGCHQGVLDLSLALFDRGNGAEVASIENDYLSGTLHKQIIP